MTLEPMTHEHYRRLAVILGGGRWWPDDEVMVRLRHEGHIETGSSLDEVELTESGRFLAEAWTAFMQSPALPKGSYTLAQKCIAAEARAASAEKRVREAAEVYDGAMVEDWVEAVKNEAAHQVVRWGTEHDEGKDPEAWFWLLGRLAGKAVDAARRGDLHKALHHTVSSGAVLLNWHARLSAKGSLFRPGTSEEDTQS